MASVERIHRLLRLVEILQSGRVYNSRHLAELCGVSRRTIFRDLRTLQDSGIQIRYEEERQGYSLPAETFLPPTDLTLEETLSLLVLCHELGDRERGIPFHRPAQTAALKLLSTLPNHLQEQTARLTESIAVRLDPRNPLVESQPHYELLIHALTERRRVRILYRSLTEWEDISTLLSPYRVLFNRRSWYVIGRSSLHRSVRTFNVGRIRQAELVEGNYQIPPRFSLERYLGNAWNMIRGPEKQCEVVVRFQKLVASNVAEVHWHKTQQVVFNDDETIDFHVTVDGLREITWWILGYGDQAEVLKPRELRNAVQRCAESMLKVYKKKTTTRTKRRPK